ncbi:hypothetical protein ACWGDE_07130 [Streptomyces sp. NPDC054956]
MPTMKVLPAALATAAAAAAFLGFAQSPGTDTVVQEPAVHHTNEPFTADRIRELSRTGQIRPAGPLPMDKNGNIVEPKP